MDYVVERARTPIIAWCKRQIVDGEDGIGWVIECWTYFPNRTLPHIQQWIVLYNGPQ